MAPSLGGQRCQQQADTSQAGEDLEQGPSSSLRQCPVSHELEGNGTCPFATVVNSVGRKPSPNRGDRSPEASPPAWLLHHGRDPLGADGEKASKEPTDEKVEAEAPAQPPPEQPWTAVEDAERLEHLESVLQSEELIREKPAAFGRCFYEEIFANDSQHVRDPWVGVPQDRACGLLANVAQEVLRLVRMPTRGQLKAGVAGLALRHIDYGAIRDHAVAFGACLLRAMQRRLACAGGAWNSEVEDAWRWSYGVVIEELMLQLEALKPMVDNIRRSWRRLITGGSLQTSSSKSKLSHSSSNTGNSCGSGDALSIASSKTKVSRSRARAKLLDIGVVSFDEAKDSRSALLAKVGDNFLEGFKEVLAQGSVNFTFGPGHGKKLGGALELMVRTATQPRELDTNLWRLAKMHIGYGVDAAMLEHFESALFWFLERNLPSSLWSDAEEGWRWLWARVKESFVSVLSRWQRMQDCVESSWELVLRLVGDREAVAVAFYQRLFETHPSLQSLFQRPTNVQSEMFAATLQIVVGSVRHSKALEAEIEQLALRHHKYNLKAWHFECVGGVLLELLGQVVGDQFTEEVRDAWAMLYKGISHTFLDILEGQSRNTMAEALVRSSVEGVSAALASMPRGDRARSALAVSAGSSTLSPLLWAIRDGFRDIAQLLLADLVAVRADRCGYYHGIKELWAVCPDVLQALVEFMPDLLQLLFDGHMLVDKEVVEGLRRVNLWVSHIYGDPEQIEDVYCSPLGILVDRLPEAFLPIFSHPVVAATVDLKWQRFGRSSVLLLIAQQMGCLVALIAFQRAQAGGCLWLVLTSLCIWLLLCCTLLLGTGYMVLHQVIHCRFELLQLPFLDRTLSLPRCLFEAFVWLRICCCSLSVALIITWAMSCGLGFGAERCWQLSPTQRYLMASISWLQWMQVTETFMLSNHLSAVLYIGVAMIRDALRFMGLVVVWLVAMGAAVHQFVAMDCEGKECEGESESFAAPTGLSSIFVMLSATLGIAGEETVFYEGKNEVMVKAFFTIALWVALIPMLNLVVSAMVSTYTRIEEFTKDLAVRARADLLVQVEDLMGQRARCRYWSALNFQQPLELARLERGLPGGISFLSSSKELEAHPSFLRRTDVMLRFPGLASKEVPWPAHEVPGGPASAKPRGASGQTQAELERLRADVADLKLLIREQSAALTGGTGGFSRTASLGAQDVRQCAIPIDRLKALQSSLGEGTILLAIEGQIYNATDFAAKHPGGKEPLRRHSGTDATARFVRHNNVQAARMALAQLPRLGIVAREAQDDGD